MDVGLVSFAMLLFSLSWSSLSVNCDVVHVYGEPPLGHLFLKYCVYHHLEGGRRVSKAKEHYSGFKEAFQGEEGGFPFIPWFDPDIVVPPVDIELSEEGAATEAVNSLQDQRGDIVILLHPLIDRPVVLDQAELPVFLFDKEEVGSVGTPQLADSPLFEVLCHKLVGLCYFILFQWQKPAWEGIQGLG
jgi:hypothetical protein